MILISLHVDVRIRRLVKDVLRHIRIQRPELRADGHVAQLLYREHCLSGSMTGQGISRGADITYVQIPVTVKERLVVIRLGGLEAWKLRGLEGSSVKCHLICIELAVFHDVHAKG